MIPFVERMDYLSYFFNMEAFCGAVERLLEIEIPDRAKYLRVIHLELNRLHSHLVWLGTSALDVGAISMLWYAFRDRDTVLDLFEMSTGQRMHTRYFQVGGVIEDIPLGFEAKLREFIAEMPARVDQFEALLDRNEIFLQRTKGSASSPASACSSWASPGRCCGRPASRGTCARSSTTSPTRSSTSTSRWARSAIATTASGCGWLRCASR